MDLSPVDIKLEGIGHILRDRRLQVPPYQRQYSWELEEVEDFWWDLKAAFSSINPQYFLGSIVLTHKDAAIQSSIVDGQQRLTTTSLLFLAVRNEFLRRGEESRAKVIESDYALARDLRSGEQVTRLALNSEDQPTYELIVSKRPVSGEQLDSAGEPAATRLANAILFLETQIQSEAKSAGRNWPETLFRWVEFIEQRARVITVSVADESDAFLVFETLNARGKALTVADLLKNYLFGLAGTELETLQKSWVSALRTLEASATEEVFTTYLRQLWSSLRGLTRERELYAQLKAAIRSKSDALKFGQEIEDAAGAYAAILSADQPYWAAHASLQPLAETMLRLGLEQNRPMLLAAMRHFTEGELQILFRSAISWSIRGIVVGGLGGGTTEKAYAEAAVAISEGRARTAAAVFEELSGIVPSDESFRQSFATRRITRTRIAKYMLIALTQLERRDGDPIVVSNSVESSYRLISTLPRNANVEEWPAFNSDEIAQWTYRLGNMFLVHAPDMSEAPFVEAISRTGWSPIHISRRQDVLAEAAVRLWPRRA